MTEKWINTKQNIIDKSLQLFSENGYYNTHINEILKATRLSKGGLYSHFHAKEEIWYASYDNAVKIWKSIVLKGVWGIEDPLDRIEKVLENYLKDYLGKDVIQGGCFFLTMLVDLSGHPNKKLNRVIDGIIGFSNMLHRWLLEAQEKNRLKSGLALNEIADFITISVNGCTALYASTRDPVSWKLTLSQLRYYIHSLEK